jgi:hypothetical protein
VLNDIRDITLARNCRNGQVALVSYENKVIGVLLLVVDKQAPYFLPDQAPPQLWKMELVKDRENNAVMTARLSLRSVFGPFPGISVRFNMQRWQAHIHA